MSFSDTTAARRGATEVAKYLAKEGVCKQAGARLLANIIAQSLLNNVVPIINLAVRRTLQLVPPEEGYSTCVLSGTKVAEGKPRSAWNPLEDPIILEAEGIDKYLLPNLDFVASAFYYERQTGTKIYAPSSIDEPIVLPRPHDLDETTREFIREQLRSSPDTYKTDLSLW